jgi:hypothetical protein
VGSGTSPLAISIMSFASWAGSRGRFWGLSGIMLICTVQLSFPEPLGIKAIQKSPLQKSKRVNFGYTYNDNNLRLCVSSLRFLEISMALFKLPLSGDVNQWINPVTSWWSGNQISINLGESNSPEAEAEILRRVGTYGHQLGQITDAVIVLLRHLPNRENLPTEEREAIEKFEKMANNIADIKKSHKREALRP